MPIHEHKFNVSDKKGYVVCECGTYHSLELLPPKELYENNYWNGKTRSLIKDQVHNLLEIDSCGISKVGKMVSFVQGVNNDVLEIGVAPGVLLKKLSESGNKVIGIEPDENNIPEIKKVCGQDKIVVNGYFPECSKWLPIHKFDYIIAMDIVEHINDYDSFIMTANKYLKHNGKFIFMSPIIYEDGLYREKDFIPIEHAWIFSKKYLQEYLSSIFSEVKFDRWQVGHEVVVCTK